MLAAPVLAFGHDAGRQVRDTHSRVGLVDVLATGAAGTVGVYAQVRRVDLDRYRFVGLRQHSHRAGAGVNAALGFGRWHALYAVSAGLELECAINIFALDAQYHFLEATQFTRRLAQDLGLPALAFAKAAVHAQQVAGKQGRFVTARAGADFNEGVARVVRVLGQQHALQFTLKLADLGAGAVDFFLCHAGHIGVVAGTAQQILRCGQIGFALLVARPARGHRSDLGVFTREQQKLLHVLHDVLAREQELQLPEPVGVACKLLTEKGFHGRWDKCCVVG